MAVKGLMDKALTFTTYIDLTSKGQMAGHKIFIFLGCHNISKTNIPGDLLNFHEQIKQIIKTQIGKRKGAPVDLGKFRGLFKVHILTFSDFA